MGKGGQGGGRKKGREEGLLCTPSAAGLVVTHTLSAVGLVTQMNRTLWQQ